MDLVDAWSRHWLDRVDRKISATLRQLPCLGRTSNRSTRRRASSGLERFVPDVPAWQASRPRRKVNWRFTTAEARIKLRRLYPSIP